MNKSCQVVDLSIDGNHIDVTVTVEVDGALTIYDMFCGPAAEDFCGEGRDMECWLRISPDGVRQLSETLPGKAGESSGAAVAEHLALTYWGDGRALSKIQSLLDANGIHYEKTFWY